MKDPEEYWSIESMEKTIGKVLDVEKVYETVVGRRKYIYFKDTEGNGWYKTQLRTAQGWEDEEKALFGNKKRKR